MVHDRLDAGVRIGESIAKGMVSVRIGGDERARGGRRVCGADDGTVHLGAEAETADRPVR